MSYLVLFVLVFFSPLSISIASLVEEITNLSAFRTFVRFVLVWFCLFPLPLVVWDGLRLVMLALPWTFLLPFIVKVLVAVFKFVGLQSLFSRIRAQISCHEFQQVMQELGITQYRSSPYHCESQGALERFYHILKNIIRSYCFDIEKDLDEDINLLLFAIRESVQESLGFSPFELVFGHTVRGPLKTLKLLWHSLDFSLTFFDGEISLK